MLSFIRYSTSYSVRIMQYVWSGSRIRKYTHVDA